LQATHALQVGTTQPPLRTAPGTMHIHPTRLASFPHTMLSVKRVKDNMQLAFIEKLSTNREIGTNV
jgi:hypothetical protein